MASTRDDETNVKAGFWQLPRQLFFAIYHKIDVGKLAELVKNFPILLRNRWIS